MTLEASEHEPIILFLSVSTASFLFFPETHPMHKTPNHLSSSTLFTITGKDLNPDQRLNFWNSTAESTSSKLNFPPISLLLLRTFFYCLTLAPVKWVDEIGLGGRVQGR